MIPRRESGPHLLERQFQEFEPLELIHAPQVGQPRTANAGPAQVEPSQSGEAAQVGQTRVGHRGMRGRRAG